MPGSQSALREICLRSLLWLLLGGWIGSWACFALLAAPTAFRVLPSTELAGRFVGPVVSALHVYGAAAGVLLALLAWRLGRGGLALLSLAAAALCAYSELRITSQLAAIRPLVFGPDGSPELAARYQYLHRVSVLNFFLVGLSTLALLVAHVRADVARDRS